MQQPESAGTGKSILAVILTLAAAITYLIIALSVQRFGRLFTGFGDDLPLLTKFVYSMYPFFAAFFLVALVPCIALLRNRDASRSDRLFSLVVIGFAIALTFGVLTVAATYAPMFAMGEVS